MNTLWKKQAIRQAEFLNKLSALMKEFDAEFRWDDGNEQIEVSACGTWIPYHESSAFFTVDDCIAATQATIEHAEALEG